MTDGENADQVQPRPERAKGCVPGRTDDQSVHRPRRHAIQPDKSPSRLIHLCSKRARKDGRDKRARESTHKTLKNGY